MTEEPRQTRFEPRSSMWFTAIVALTLLSLAARTGVGQEHPEWWSRTWRERTTLAEMGADPLAATAEELVAVGRLDENAERSALVVLGTRRLCEGVALDWAREVLVGGELLQTNAVFAARYLVVCGADDPDLRQLLRLGLTAVQESGDTRWTMTSVGLLCDIGGNEETVINEMRDAVLRVSRLRRAEWEFGLVEIFRCDEDPERRVILEPLLQSESEELLLFVINALGFHPAPGTLEYVRLLSEHHNEEIRARATYMLRVVAEQAIFVDPISDGSGVESTPECPAETPLNQP